MKTDVHFKVTEKEGGKVLYSHTFKFNDLRKKDGTVNVKNENRMLKKIKDTKKNLESTYPQGYLVVNYQNVKDSK